MTRGKLITFEGCEGAGKSTQLELLRAEFVKRNIPCLFTREPGGSRLAEEIRRMILSAKNTDMTDACEALLYAAARAQLLEEVISPALDAGKTVVCDRYLDSSYAYQGYARGLGIEEVRRYNDFAVQHFLPDLTLFLDIDPVSAFARKHGADEDDRMEQAGMDFHKKVYRGYLEIAKAEPNRFVPVSAYESAEEIHGSIMRLLTDKGLL